MTAYAIHAAIMTVGSAAAGLGVYFASRRWSPRLRWGAVAVSLLALLAYLAFVRDGALLARLPATDVLAFGEALPLLAAVFLAVAFPLVKRKWIVFPASAVVIFASYRPLFTPAPRILDRQKDGCVIQTSPTSCSPAAAAILLRQHGIPATESEMAPLCMTRSFGTPFHGLVRGLRSRTRGTEWSVSIETPSFERLQAPAILVVELTSDVARRDPRYEGPWGWTVGEKHVVVFLGIDTDGVRIADPSIGFERWGVENLRDLWTGVAVRLVK